MLRSKIKKIKSQHWRILALPLLVAVAFAFSGFYSLVSAAPSKVINYQGKLTDNSNVPVADTNYSIKFTIWDAAGDGAGNCLWSAQGSCGTPTAKTVATVSGIFSSMLGEAGDNALNLDFNSNYWLQIQVGADSPMSPRRQITVSGYAINAGTLDAKTWGAPGVIGSTTPNAASFTTISSTGNSQLATTAGSTLDLGNSTGAATVASGGTSAWTNTSGNLTISTVTSGTLAITSVGALNLTAGAASTVSLANLANAINFDSGTLSIDALNNRLGVGTTAPTATLQVKAGTTAAGSAPLKFTLGTNMTVAEAGAFEYDGSELYFTPSGTTRRTISYLDSAMTGTLDGVNLATGNQGGVPYFSSTTQLTSSAAGTTGQALISGGTGAPTWFAPTAGSILFAGTGGILQQDNANFFWDDTSNYLQLGNGTANKFSFGLDSGDADKFKIYSGSGISGTSEFSIDTNGLTSISNLELGAMNFADDSGAISWVDMNVVSALDNTVESYTAQLDGTDMLTIYGQSNGSGGVDNLRVLFPNGNIGIGTTNPAYNLQVAGSVGVGGSAVFSGLSNDGSEATAVLINGSNQLVYRELGSNAFNSTAFLSGIGIGTTVSGATTGSIFFAGTGGILDQDNANFFWNNSLNYLGLGTTAPGSALDVAGIIRATNGSNYISMYHNGTDGIISSSSGEVMIGAGGDFILDNGVNFGIGVDTPAGMLHIGSSSPFIVTSVGNVGIGTTVPGHVGFPILNGVGLDDMTSGGVFTGTAQATYWIEIDGTGTPDTFKWSDDNSATWGGTAVQITGAAQTLNNGVTITFGATTGHTSGDYWQFVANPYRLKVDGAVAVSNGGLEFGTMGIDSGGKLRIGYNHGIEDPSTPLKSSGTLTLSQNGSGFEVYNTSGRASYIWVNGGNGSMTYDTGAYPDGAGAVIGHSFGADFSQLNSGDDGYTAFLLNVADAGVGSSAPRYLMNLQTGSASRFSVTSAGNTRLAGNLGVGNTAGFYNIFQTDQAQAGDITYILPTTTPVASGYALVSTTGGVMSWAAMTGGGMSNPMTTAGDIIYAGASGSPLALAGSGTNGWVLTYNTGSSAPEWVAPGAGHTQNTDTGTTGASFVVGSSLDSAAVDLTMQFGGTNPETFYFDGNGTDNFLLSDDLDVSGGLTATTINGNTFTTGTGVLTLAAGKTLTANNTLTFTGTDSSSVDFGAGGTVAYTANLHNAVTLGTDQNGLSLATQVLSMGTASATTTGSLTSGDWGIFNGKQAGSSNLTSLSGLTFASTSFVKMTGANTFALDTTPYLSDGSVYALLAGRAGSQVLNGGTAASEILRLSSTANGTKGKVVFGTGGSGYDELNNRLGVGTTNPSYKLDVLTGTTVANERGINISNVTTAAGTNYGVYSSVTGASTTNIGGYFAATGASNNVGLQVAGMAGTGATGLDIGAMSGTTNNAINIGAMSGTTDTAINIGALSGTGNLSVLTTATTSVTTTGAVTGYILNLGNITTTSGTATSHNGIRLGDITGAATNSRGIIMGALSGGVTTNYGIDMGVISGSGTTNAGINIAALTSTGTTSSGLYINGLSGAATTDNGVYIGAISGAGTTNNGLYINTISGGATTTKYGINLAGLTSSGASVNKAILIGAISGSTGASTNAMMETGSVSGAATNNYGINLGAVSGATTNYGINLAAITGGTTNYGINLASTAATASATNYGINIGGLTGTAASSTNYGLNIGTMSATGTATYGLKIAGPTGAATSNYGLNVTTAYNAGSTHNATLELGTASAEAGTWALFSSINSPSYLLGSLGIGTTNPSQGTLTLNGGAGSNLAILQQGDMLFYDTDNSNYVGLQATSVSGANLVYTLPGSAPAADGYALVSTTGGTMSWAAAGGGVTDGNKGDVTVSGSGATWNVNFSTTDGAGSNSNASGLEEGTSGIGLLQGCGADQILKWNDTTSVWYCTADVSGGAASITINSSTVTGGTSGSVLFLNGSSQVSQDNANFSWNDTENNLAIGGKVTVSGTTSNIVKTSSGDKSLTTDFEYNGSGTTAALYNTTAVQNAIVLASPATTYTIAGSGAATGGTVNPGGGAHSIIRDDGKIIIIHGNTSPQASIWDGSSTGTMSTAPAISTVNVGTGAISLRRPNGRYLIINGNGTLGSTSVFDPWGIAATAAGPAVCSGVGTTTGTNAFLRPDGRYQIICGGSTNTGVYDPSLAIASGYTAGPTAPNGLSFGAGAHTLQRDDGTFMVMVGGGTTANGIFNAHSNTFSGTAPGLTSNVTTGAVSIRRSDGKYLVMPGTAGVSFIYDPTPTFTAPNGTFTSAPAGPSVALGDGAQIVWRPDGKYILVTGNSTNVNIVNIEGDTPVFTSGAGYNLSAPAAAGLHLIPRPDGKYQIVRGGGTAITDSLDMSLVMGGMTGAGGTGPQSAYWESECIDWSTSLNPTSTLSWNKNSEGVVNVQAKTGTACGSLSAYRNIPNSGDKVGAVTGDNKIKIKVFLKRNFPTAFDQDWGLWRGLSQTKYRRRVMDPALYDITINNSSLFHRSQFELGMGVSANQDASGPVASNVNVAANGSLQLSQGLGNTNLGSSTNPMGNAYAGSFGTHTSLNQEAGEGSIAMKRPDGTYMILVGAPILGGTNPPTVTAPAATTAEIYDPVAQTFTNNGTAATAGSFGVVCSGSTGNTACLPNDGAAAVNIGRGSLAFKRPDGKFFIVNGQGSRTGGTAPSASTSIYDPVASTFSSGPSLAGVGVGITAVAGRGSQAMALPNGNVMILHGDLSRNTSIYNPLQNTMIPGPTAPAVIGVGSIVIPRPDGGWLLIPGLSNSMDNAVACALQTPTYIFDPYLMRFYASNLALTGTGPGAFAFQRSDGNWVIVAGGATTGTCAATNRYNVYNPVSNRMSANQTLLSSATVSWGAGAMQRPDGSWLIVGGSSPQTQIYVEKGGAASDGIMAGTAGFGGIFAGTAPGVAGKSVGIGGFNFQRDDGKFVQISGIIGVYGTAVGGTGVSMGNSSATVLQYDAGWVTSGSYKTEQLYIRDMDANSTLSWKTSGPSSAGVTAEVRTSATRDGLQTASTNDVLNGGMINGGTDPWVQVNFNFSRTFPSKEGVWSDVWMGNSSVKNQTWRNIINPSLSEFKINKDSDLLNLKADGLSLFRVSSNGDIYTSANGAVKTGGADLAENYSSQEYLEKGEVVAIDPINNHSVKKALYQNQPDVLGVVSSDPGFVAGAFTEDSYPIALVGRVPVKVSTENGNIKAGDYLTAASVPGHAMKATRSGRVLGKALENLDATKMSECPEGGYNVGERKCGTVMMFVNLTDYSGVPIEKLMAEMNTSDAALVTDAPIVSEDGLTVVLAPQKLADANSFEGYSRQAEILDFLKKLKAEEGQSSNPSEIFTGRLSADEVIAPTMFADLLVAKRIKADSIEGLEFIQTDIAETQDGVTLATSQIGNLGTEIESLKKQLSDMTLSSIGLAKFADLETAGGIVVGGASEFRGPAVFLAMAEFVDKTIFRNDVEFAGTATFNRDMAGYAVVKTKSNGVRVIFDKEYAAPPIVTAALSLQQIKDTEVRKASEELLLVSDVKFIITNVTEKGFEIRINQIATSEIPFAWQAVAIADAQTFQSAEDQFETAEVLPVLPSESENVIIPPTETAENAIPVMFEPTIEPEIISVSTDPVVSDNNVINP